MKRHIEEIDRISKLSFRQLLDRALSEKDRDLFWVVFGMIMADLDMNQPDEGYGIAMKLLIELKQEKGG